MNGTILEALDEKGGRRWRIRVIRAGLSGNGNYYSAAVLREALPLFEGVRVFVKSDEEHIRGQGKDFRNLIGKLSDAVFVEGQGADSGEIQATLSLIEADGEIAVKLREAAAADMSDLFGFSIVATVTPARRRMNGRTVREAKRFQKVNSVDLIVEPGAGGGVINLIEALQGDDMRDKLIKIIEAKKPDLLKDKNVEELTDDELLELTEALAEPPAAEDPPADPAPTGSVSDDDERGAELTEALRRVERIESRSLARTLIAEAKLPDAAKIKLRKSMIEGEAVFTEAQIRQTIKDEQDYLAQFTESGAVQDLGTGGRFTGGDTPFERAGEMFDAFFDREHKDHRQARSFRECYVSVTGDRHFTGEIDRRAALFTESLDSSSFANVLGDSITRRLLADYRTMSNLDVWRLIATVVSVNDFRVQERTRVGGYGDIPDVAQSAPYLPLGSPTDEKATYAISKKGGTEDVTLEMIRNDDVGTISRIPIKLSRAAKRTLSKFVMDPLLTNPVIYDGVALFHASHGNLGAAALSGPAFAAARLAMLDQKEPGSNEPLSLPLKSLFVPNALEEPGADLFRRNTENDKTFIQSQNPQVVPVWYWTDPNDWVAAADPDDLPMIEVGFLDGQEEPSLFVQDQPNVGSMFTNDKVTYKIRHIYGATVTDFRGFYKGVVA